MEGMAVPTSVACLAKPLLQLCLFTRVGGWVYDMYHSVECESVFGR